MNYLDNYTIKEKSNNSRYSTKLKKEKRKKQLIRLILITLTFGICIGAILGSVITSIILNPNDTLIENENTKLNTNQVEDLSWSSGQDINFYPLNVEMDLELQEYIYYLSLSNEVDFPLVMGLIRTESNFQNHIISQTDDYGLMQINTINHEWLSEELGFDDYLDPYQNVNAGIHILGELFKKYEEPSKVLMAYNLGESKAREFWDRGIFESEYSRKVLEYTRIYTNEINNKKSKVAVGE